MAAVYTSSATQLPHIDGSRLYKLCSCAAGRVDALQVGLKTGWENPVPIDTVYRFSRPNTVSTGNTGNRERNQEKPAKSGTESVQGFS